MEELINEIREEFHIPPYCSDDSLQNKVKAGIAYLSLLNPGQDYETDLVYRDLLKNYVWYSYQGMTSDYITNYGPMILTWQMETEVETEDTSES